MAGGDLTGQASANAAVGINDYQAALQTAMALDGGQHLRIGEQLVFQHRAIAMGRGAVVEPGAAFGLGNGIKQAGEIEGAGLGQGHRTGLQKLAAADQVFEPGHAKHAQQLAHFFGHKEEEIDHMFRQTREAIA